MLQAPHAAALRPAAERRAALASAFSLIVAAGGEKGGGGAQWRSASGAAVRVPERVPAQSGIDAAALRRALAAHGLAISNGDAAALLQRWVGGGAVGGLSFERFVALVDAEERAEAQRRRNLRASVSAAAGAAAAATGDGSWWRDVWGAPMEESSLASARSSPTRSLPSRLSPTRLSPRRARTAAAALEDGGGLEVSPPQSRPPSVVAFGRALPREPHADAARRRREWQPPARQPPSPRLKPTTAPRATVPSPSSSLPSRSASTLSAGAARRSSLGATAAAARARVAARRGSLTLPARHGLVVMRRSSAPGVASVADMPPATAPAALLPPPPPLTPERALLLSAQPCHGRKRLIAGLMRREWRDISGVVAHTPRLAAAVASDAAAARQRSGSPVAGASPTLVAADGRQSPLRQFRARIIHQRRCGSRSPSPPLPAAATLPSAVPAAREA